jgi:hypothetical protein
MHAIRVATAAAALAAMTAPALAEAPIMYTRWKDTALTRQDCVARGRAAVAAAGFGNIKTSAVSVFGHQGGHCAVTVRCAAEKRLVFFAAASTNMDACQRLTDRVADGF